MNTNLYRLLDVPTDADNASIKQAAQKRLQTFKQAYKILSSKQKRPVYDERYAQQPDNFYALLEVPQDADLESIKQAVQDKVEAVKQAYAVLGHPKKRAAYDQAQQINSIEAATETDAKEEVLDVDIKPESPPPVESQPATTEIPAPDSVEPVSPPPATKKKTSFLGRVFKFAAITVAILVLLLGLAVLGVYLFFDANNYKQEIETLVKEQTGREFNLEGELKLSVFPWVGLELNQARMGNAPGFEDPLFAQIDRLQVNVKLMPLLSQKVEMDTLNLMGAEVHLTRLADGRTNWDDLIAKDAQPKEQPKPDSQGSFDLANLQIGGINIQNAAVKWDDQQNQQMIQLSNTNLEMGAIALPAPIQVDLDAHINTTQPAPTDLKLALSTQVQFNPTTSQLDINNLVWRANIQNELAPQGEQMLQLELQHLVLDQTAQTVSIKELMLSTLGMTLHTDVNIFDFLTAPDISGKLRVDEFKPREVLSHLGQTGALPDSVLLQTASMDFDFNVQLESGDVLVNELIVKVDDNQLLVPLFQWNMQNNTMQMDKLSLQVADLKAEAQVQMKNLFGVMQLQGDFEVQPFNVKTLMTDLGLPAIETQDANAFNKVAVKTQLVGDFAHLKLDNFQLTLDDSQLIGAIQVKPAKQAIMFDLVMDQLNLDGYLSPANQSVPSASQTTPEFPFEQLRQLNLDGKFALHTLQVQGQQVQNMRLGVFAEDGDIKLSYYQDYQGLKSNTRLLLDAKQAPAKLNLTQTIEEQTVGGSKVSFESNLNLQKNLQFTGDISLSVNKLRQLLQKFQVSLPDMQDSNTLHSFSLNAKGLQGDLQNLAVQQLQIALDETKVNGNVSVANFTQPALIFDLHADQINLDRYLPTPSDTPPPTPEEVEQRLPLEALRQLNIDGTVKLDKLQVNKLHVQNLKLGVKGKDGDIRVENTVSLYQGQLQADVHLDARQTPAKLRVKKQLSGLQAEPLFNDLQAGKGSLKGQANFDVDLTATGERPQDLINSLSGDVEFNFADGAIKGFDLDRTIAMAKAALGKGNMPPPVEGELETDFSELKGAMKLDKGHLHTDDIQLKAPYLHFTGSGDVALTAQSMDYRLDVTIFDKNAVDAGNQQASSITLPVTLTGPLQKPKVNFDIQAFLAQEAERRLDKEIETRADKLREDVEQKLDEKLEQKGDELKEKALDKLRGIF